MPAATRIRRQKFQAAAVAAALALCLVTQACLSPGERRGDGIARESGPTFDARLTSYPYPYAVHVLPVDAKRDLELAYMDVSPARPNGRAVLLLHGKNFSGAYWRRTIEALADDGYRVIVPDQIGFGKSSKPTDFQYSFHLLADLTKRLLDHLHVDEVSVVGHSMGGMLATRFALMHPDAVERLVLVNPIGLEDWQRVVPYVSVEVSLAKELRQTPESIRAYMRENYFHGEWKPEYDELDEIQAGWTRGPARRRIAHVAALTTDMVFTQPVLYEFGQLRPATLLVIGQLDRTAIGKDRVAENVAARLGNYPELGRAAARAIPRAKLVELPDAGHVPQYEAFDAYYAALRDFLG